MEDLDLPRVVPGAADQIVRALETFGFQWSGPILRQSTRAEAYEAALERLLAAGLVYPCSCSRSELRAAQPRVPAPGEELHYPGWCRQGMRAPERTPAMRFLVVAGTTSFEDELQGLQGFDVGADVGDFVIRRRDRLHAYQLAVVVDDAAQGITHVVRGMDLLNSTPRQILLQRALCLPIPMYAHLPVATDADGVKLSKSAGAAALDTRRPAQELWRALRFLRQEPPIELRRSGVESLWEWAIQHWRMQPLRGLHRAPVDDPP